MIITLCGFMGAGKSTIGKYLSNYLGFKFIDLDQYIEQKHNCTVSDLFALNGEKAFRDEEFLSLSAIIEEYRNKDLVLSLGGGTLTNAQCGPIVSQTSCCIYLHCTKEELVRRLSRNESKRPVLTQRGDLSLDEHIERLMKGREPIYRKYANFVVDTSKKDIAGIIDQILKII